MTEFEAIIGGIGVVGFILGLIGVVGFIFGLIGAVGFILGLITSFWLAYEAYKEYKEGIL